VRERKKIYAIHNLQTISTASILNDYREPDKHTILKMNSNTSHRSHTLVFETTADIMFTLLLAFEGDITESTFWTRYMEPVILLRKRLEGTKEWILIIGKR